MNAKEILILAGLTERESKVYIALLELGQSTTGPIIKKSGVPNSKIYEIMESLQNKGLLSWIVKGKIKHFTASDPNKLISLLNEKMHRIEDGIPELSALMNKAGKGNKVELFEGIKAIRSMFIDILSQAKAENGWFGFTTGESSTGKEVQLFYEWLGALKREYRIIDHLLVSWENKTVFCKAHNIGISKYWQVRFSEVSFPGDVGIFDDKVILLNWDEPKTAILITSNSLARQYRDFFRGIWLDAKI